MTPYARFLFLSLLAIAVILLSPLASAGMVWGMYAGVLGVAPNAQDEIYLATSEAVFKIRNNDTIPQASVESMGDRARNDYRPIAASRDGSRVAIAAADCTKGCPYDRVLLTNGDLEPLQVLDLQIPSRGVIGEYGVRTEVSLHLSEDGSRLYARTDDGITAVRTSDGSVLWSVSCGGPSRAIVSLVYSGATDRVGYSCGTGEYVTGVGNIYHSLVSVVDGSLGIPLWGQTFPGLTTFSMSPSGHWIQVKSWTGVSLVSLFEYPSVVPEITWDHGEVVFLSDDDRFVHFEREEAEGDSPNNTTIMEYTFEWYKPPETGAIPELMATKSFVGGAVFSPLAMDSNFLLIHADPFERGEIPEWQDHHDRYLGKNSTVSNYTLYRFDRDGALLEKGNAWLHGGSLLPIPDSLDVILHIPGSNAILFESGVTNTRPLIERPCDWEGDVATLDVHDPDGDQVKLHWNLSGHRQLGVVLSTEWVDATGPSLTVEDDSRVSVVAIDEHGASSSHVCDQPTESDPIEYAGGPPIWAMLTALLLLGVFGRGVHRAAVRRS